MKYHNKLTVKPFLSNKMRHNRTIQIKTDEKYIFCMIFLKQTNKYNFAKYNCYTKVANIFHMF